jgi:hypothetical protein
VEEKTVGEVAEAAEVINGEGKEGDVGRVDGLDDGVVGYVGVGATFEFRPDAEKVSRGEIGGLRGGGLASEMGWNGGEGDVDGECGTVARGGGFETKG